MRSVAIGSGSWRARARRRALGAALLAAAALGATVIALDGGRSAVTRAPVEQGTRPSDVEPSPTMQASAPSTMATAPAPSSQSAPARRGPSLDPDLRVGDEVEGASRHALALAGQERAADVAAFYRGAARRPAESFALAPGRDPILESARPQPSVMRSADGTSVEVVASPWAVGPDDTLSVKVALEDSSHAPNAAARGIARLVGTDGVTLLAEIPLAASADGTLSGSWRIPPARIIDGDPGIHTLMIAAVRPDGSAVAGKTAVQVSAPALRLTGRYRDAIVSGDLVVATEVRATKAVRAHVAATIAPLQDVGGMRAYAERATFVKPGTTWIEVVFAGSVVHSLGAAGPYEVTALAVSDTSRFPPARLPVQESPYTTSAYSLDALRAEVPEDESLAALARYVEER